MNTMKITQEIPQPIQALSEKIELLHSSSNQMIEVMERQIEAIIASNTSQIEELANLHASLTIRYTENEQDFINELNTILSTNKEKGIKLVALKELFPECSSQIEYWQNLLQQNVKKLQTKHRQIVELLEFAMNSNAKMLETLYSKHSEKNTHYSTTGRTTSILPGVAVNQKI